MEITGSGLAIQSNFRVHFLKLSFVLTPAKFDQMWSASDTVKKAVFTIETSFSRKSEKQFCL